MSSATGESLTAAENGSCRHFSVTSTGGSVPVFLRLIALKIEELGDPEVLDISFARYWTREEGKLEYETTMTVYYD